MLTELQCKLKANVPKLPAAIPTSQPARLRAIGAPRRNHKVRAPPIQSALKQLTVRQSLPYWKSVAKWLSGRSEE